LFGLDGMVDEEEETTAPATASAPVPTAAALGEPPPPPEPIDLHNIEPSALDVDWISVCITPTLLPEYLGSVDGLLNVTLCSNRPRFSDEEYQKWLCVVSAPCIILVSEMREEQKLWMESWFYETEELQITAAESTLTLIDGYQQVSIGRLSELLVEMGYHTTRVIMYNQKDKDLEKYIGKDPILASHPHAPTNQFDIGMNWRFPHQPNLLPLFRFARRWPGKTVIPLFGPVGAGAGGLMIDLGRGVRVKVYHELVHIIKSRMAKLSLNVPTNVQQLNRRQGHLRGLLLLFKRRREQGRCGGFRVEFRIQRATVGEAIRWVRDQGLNSWEGLARKIGLGPTNVRFVSMDQLVYQLDEFWQQGYQRLFVEGRNEDRISPQKKSWYKYLCMMYGWNLKWSSNPTPGTIHRFGWWRTGREGPVPPDLPDLPNRLAIYEYCKMVWGRMIDKSLIRCDNSDCPNVTDPTAKLQDVSENNQWQTRFRLRCDDCKKRPGREGKRVNYEYGWFLEKVRPILANNNTVSMEEEDHDDANDVVVENSALRYQQLAWRMMQRWPAADPPPPAATPPSDHAAAAEVIPPPSCSSSTPAPPPTLTSILKRRQEDRRRLRQREEQQQQQYDPYITLFMCVYIYI
jgi:hypothetical protein